MKVFLFLVSLLLSYKYKLNCKQLEDGNYQIRFVDPNWPAYQLKLHGSHYEQTVNNVCITKGKVEYNQTCFLQIDVYNSKGKSKLTDSLNGMMSLINQNFGKPCFKIDQRKGDTTYFTVTSLSNLHLSFAKGYFVKTL